VTPHVREFVDAFRQRFGVAPDLYAAHGYDAFNVLLEAWRQGGTTGLSFWKGMRAVREFQGVTGVLQFDEKGDVTKFPHVYIVAQGKAVDVEERRQEEILKARQEIERIQREMERLRNQGN
jgi:branched-chain amino acid transport system substrate-binding protein